MKAFLQIILSQMQIVISPCLMEKIMLQIYIKEHKSKPWCWGYLWRDCFTSIGLPWLAITGQMGIMTDPTPKHMRWVCKFCVISDHCSSAHSNRKYPKFHIKIVESTLILYHYFIQHTYKNVQISNNLWKTWSVSVSEITE